MCIIFDWPSFQVVLGGFQNLRKQNDKLGVFFFFQFWMWAFALASDVIFFCHLSNVTLCWWCKSWQTFNVITSPAWFLDFKVPAGSPSVVGDVVVYVFDIDQPSLPTPFLFCSCVYFCVYGSFNCISFHKYYWQLSCFLTLFFRS